jgi:ABC-2 type transport system permease protein
MNGFRTLVDKELFEGRLKLAISFAIMAAVAVSLPLLFDWLQEAMGGMSMPEQFADTVGAQLRNYDLYLWSNWWGKNHSQIMVILALVWGMGIIARERENGVLSYILSRPVTRCTVLLAKCLTGATLLAFVSVSSSVVLVLVSGLSRSGAVPWFILRGLPQSILTATSLFMVAAVFSAALRDRIMALLASIGVVAVLTGLGFIPELKYASPLYLMAAEKTMLNGRIETPVLAVLALTSAVLYLLALRLVERIEL